MSDADEATVSVETELTPEILATIAPQAWAERVARALELSDGPIVCLVDRAQDKMIGHLARALVRSGSEPDFCVDWSETASARDGSVVVLLLRPEEFETANMMRGRIEEKRLKLVLWVHDGGRLRREANDLADWVSHTVECPDGPDPVAVRKLHLARGTLSWRSDERELVLAIRALTGTEPLILDATTPFTDLLEQIGQATQRWIVVASPSMFEVGKVRLALAARARDKHVATVHHVWPGVQMGYLRRRGLSDVARANRLIAALGDLEMGAFPPLSGLFAASNSLREFASRVPETSPPRWITSFPAPARIVTVEAAAFCAVTESSNELSQIVSD